MYVKGYELHEKIPCALDVPTTHWQEHTHTHTLFSDHVL